MTDGYSIDLEQISLVEFQRMLATKDLLPARLPLREQLEERFAVLDASGIANMQEISTALKTKARLSNFAVASGLPEEYLVLLRREVNRYVSKPLNLDKLPDVDTDCVELMADGGIKTTKHLFDRAKTHRHREELASEIGVPAEAVMELTRLSDLTRIIGIGPVSARLLYIAEIDSMEAFANTPTQELVDKLNRSIAENPHLVATTVTEKDIVYCLESANLLPQEIEYD